MVPLLEQPERVALSTVLYCTVCWLCTKSTLQFTGIQQQDLLQWQVILFYFPALIQINLNWTLWSFEPTTSNSTRTQGSSIDNRRYCLLYSYLLCFGVYFIIFLRPIFAVSIFLTSVICTCVLKISGQSNLKENCCFGTHSFIHSFIHSGCKSFWNDCSKKMNLFSFLSFWSMIKFLLCIISWNYL